MNRASGITLFWLVLLGAAAVALTVSTFYAFVLPDHRGPTFVSVIASTCVAEIVLFGYAAYFLTVPHTVKRPSPAVRMQILVLVVIWFFIVLVTGAVAVHPTLSDTFYSDKILVFQSILTFLMLAGAFFLHRQDVVLQVREEAPQQSRVRLQSFAGGVDALMDTLRSLAGQRPAQAAEIERLTKRLDTLKTQLLSVSPVAEREPERKVEPLSDEEIVEGLKQLHQSVAGLSSAGDEQIENRLASVRRELDALSGLLRRREDVLTF